MLYLKAITKDGETEYFNPKQILSIKPMQNGYYKILMGAGLFWYINPNSVEMVELDNIFKGELKR